MPYRSSADTMTDLVAGRISFAIVDLTIGLPLARGDEVRPLAVTGAARSAMLPGLPTLQEAGLAGYDISAWMAAYHARRARRPRRLDRVGAALRQVLGDAALSSRLAELGFEPMPGDAAALAAFADRRGGAVERDRRRHQHHRRVAGKGAPPCTSCPLLADAERQEGHDPARGVRAALPVTPVNIGQGDQFTDGFLAISPNNRMPAMVDHAPADGGEPIALFESGAIMMYLAEKAGPLLPAGAARARTR